MPSRRYGEAKQRRTLWLTDHSFEFLSGLARRSGLSASEMLERLLRQLEALNHTLNTHTDACSNPISLTKQQAANLRELSPNSTPDSSGEGQKSSS